MVEPRSINSLQGLLRFALQYTKSEDAPNESAFKEMDPERRQFLENVLKSMSVDVIEEFHKAIGVLESKENTTTEKLNAINTIREYIDDIDFSNNFIKIGGSEIIISCLSSENSEIKALSANLIAELTQNNPFCQKHFTEKNVLPKLIELLNDEEKVACSALYAISCLVRHYEEALAAFIKINGVKHILNCLKYDQEKLFVKACFLLNTLSTEFPIICNEFLKEGTFEKLSQFVDPAANYTTLEMILNVLCTLSSSKENLTVTAELHEKLIKIKENCMGKPECEEIVAYSETLSEKYQKK